VGDGSSTDQAAAATAKRHQAAMSVGRHPRDLVVLLIAVGVVVLCSLAAARLQVVNPVEVAIFGQFAQIPAASIIVWQVLTWAGTWAGIAAVAAVALYFKRIRLGLQIAGAGVLAWAAVRLINGLVGGRPVPAELLGAPGVRLPGPAGFAFPAPHAAVAAAMVAVATPFLLKARYRGVAWAVVVLVAAADVYLGTSLPLGAFAAVFLGWGIGAIFHLVWGAPGRRTSEAAVCRALERAGLAPVEAVPLREHLLGPLEFGVTTESGEKLRVQVVRRLHRRAGLWYRLRRLLASLEVEDEPPLSSTYHETEHEALVTLFAQRAGLRTPPVVLTCEIRQAPPLLVRRQIEGCRLTELSGDEIGESLLDAIWVQIAALSEARIAHHDLRAKNILVDTEGDPWLLNFTFGIIGASAARAAQDRAEALISLASRVGVVRAVRSAARVLSPDQLEPALPYLQPLALPRRIRKQLGQERYVLTELRETLAEQIDRPIPTFRSPVRASTVVGLLLLGGAVYALLPQVSSMRAVLDSLRSADWGWLAVATLTGFIAIVLSSVSIIGSSSTPLPFWRTTAVQFAAAFTGRTTPGGIGFFGINIAFMERLGIRRSSAVGVTMLNMAATSVIGGIWCVIGVFGIGTSGLLGGMQIPLGWPVLLAAAGSLVVAAAVLLSPFGRRKFVGPGLRVTRELLDALRRPVRAVQLVGGATGYLMISGLGLAASLAAFNVHVPVAAVIAVFVIGQTLGHIAPIPGGLGPTEALMVAGLTALGIAPTVAVGAVLTSRLLTYWLPVLPGIAIFRYLQHHGIV
jgi:glycosyltransferase 2 family protein